MRSRGSSSTSRSGSYKPTWWGVLAVALAVIAVTFGRLGHDTTGQAEPQIASTAPTARDLRLIPASPVHASRIRPQDNGSQSSPRNAAPPTSDPTAPSLPPRTDALRQATTTTQPTALLASQTFPGYLSFPDNVSSFLSLPGADGPIVVSASWLSDTPLELTVSCASTTQSSAGTYEARVSVPAVQSPCTVRLNEESPTSSPIPYTISVIDSSSH